MSEETKTELKLPAAYVRPSLAEFTGPEHGYKAEQYESFFARVEEDLAAKYASGEITDENFVDIRDPKYIDVEMTDADHDGLPDILHIKSQVRGRGNRTLRARQPTRHRFKQYLFSDPSKRLVRGRVLRVKASDVRANLDELLDKEESGILSVHAPNGQRVDLQALKAGRISLAPLPLPAPLVNKPLDSAANDIPSGENIPQHLGGSFPGDPIAQTVGERMAAEKQAEAEKKGAEGPPAVAATTESTTEDPVDAPVAAEVVSRGDDGTGAGLPELTASGGDVLRVAEDAATGAPAADPLAETELAAPEASGVVAEEQDRSSIDPAGATELQSAGLAINAGDDESPVTDEAREPVDESPKASSSKKSGKKGGHK